MSMEVSSGYGVLFGDARIGCGYVTERGASDWPWNGDEYDGSLSAWWKENGTGGKCPVVVAGGGFDGCEVAGLFLKRTHRIGWIVCRVSFHGEPGMRAELAAFLKLAGIPVPKAALFDWWAVGDYVQ